MKWRDFSFILLLHSLFRLLYSKGKKQSEWNERHRLRFISKDVEFMKRELKQEITVN